LIFPSQFKQKSFKLSLSKDLSINFFEALNLSRN